MALPTVDALVRHWPDARCDVFVGDHSRSVFSFRSTVQTRSIPDTLTLAGTLRLARTLHLDRYNVVVCLDRSRWLRVATAISRVESVAVARSRRPEHRHESEVYLDTVRAIGVPTPRTNPTIRPGAMLPPLAESPSRVAILHPGGAVNPGSTMFDKRWPANRFAALARSLEANGFKVYFSGNAADEADAREVACQAKIHESRLLTGKLELPELVAALDQAALFVGPDTGVSHLAAAVGTPTVVIFGPTNPRRYRPLGPHVEVVAPASSWSIPDRDLRRRTGDGTISTSAVSVEMVLRACQTVVADARGRLR